MSAVFKHPVSCSLTEYMVIFVKYAQIVFQLQMLTVSVKKDLNMCFLITIWKKGSRNKHIYTRDNVSLYLFNIQMEIPKTVKMTTIKVDKVLIVLADSSSSGSEGKGWQCEYVVLCKNGWHLFCNPVGLCVLALV